MQNLSGAVRSVGLPANIGHVVFRVAVCTLGTQKPQKKTRLTFATGTARQQQTRFKGSGHFAAQRTPTSSKQWCHHAVARLHIEQRVHKHEFSARSAHSQHAQKLAPLLLKNVVNIMAHFSYHALKAKQLFSLSTLEPKPPVSNSFCSDSTCLRAFGVFPTAPIHCTWIHAVHLTPRLGTDRRL